MPSPRVMHSRPGGMSRTTVPHSFVPRRLRVISVPPQRGRANYGAGVTIPVPDQHARGKLLRCRCKADWSPAKWAVGDQQHGAPSEAERADRIELATHRNSHGPSPWMARLVGAKSLRLFSEIGFLR
jgi:hypothetical protein